MVTTLVRRRHHFAAVGKAESAHGGDLELKGVVFDMDGTLCESYVPFQWDRQAKINHKKASHRTTCSQKCAQRWGSQNKTTYWITFMDSGTASSKRPLRRSKRLNAVLWTVKCHSRDS